MRGPPLSPGTLLRPAARKTNIEFGASCDTEYYRIRETWTTLLSRGFLKRNVPDDAS